MAQTVIGIFDTLGDAENAARQLANSGFSRDNMDVTVQGEADYDTTSATPSASSMNRNDDDFGDKVGRFFRNLFDDDDEANRYSTVARKGAVLTLFTDSNEEAMRAADILDQCGAINVDDRAREYSYSTSNRTLDTGSDTNSPSALTDTTSPSALTDTTSPSGMMGEDMRSNYTPDRDINANSDSIPVIEENLAVGKREVRTGGVRLRSRIIERPVEETLRLREEFVRVERTPVNRPATEADFNTFKEGEIELTETAEVPVVSKEARVVEEVRLNKEVEEREEVIRDTVRSTDVDIEQISPEEQINRKRDI